MLDGTHEIVELDLHTATPADVQTFVDDRYETAWRATGARVLRRDLPFLGPTLRTRGHGLLTFTNTLAENGVGKYDFLCTYWPPNHRSEKDRRRCGIGEPCNEADGRMVKRAPRKEKKIVQKAEKRAQRRTADEVNAANETDVRVERDGKTTDMNEQGEEKEKGPERGGERPAEENGVEQAEDGQQELLRRAMERPVDSMLQNEGDSFTTFDENKENWDPRVVAAALFWRAQYSV